MYPRVNTYAKIPKRMLDALCIFEAFKVLAQDAPVTEDEVKSFLAERYGQKLADQFKPEYLVSSQGT